MQKQLNAPTTVDEYIAEFPADVQEVLKKVRATVRAVAPAAEERLSYRMPAYFQGGVLVYFAAFKKHIGFYPPVRDPSLTKRLSRYAGPKGNLQFPLAEPIPYPLITEIVKARIKESSARTTSRDRDMAGHRIFRTPFAAVYPMYVQKVERKGRTKEEVDRVICWLTGYDQAGLLHQIEHKTDFATFFAQAPAMNPNSSNIKGVVCGVRVEEVDNPLMKKIRQLDKLIDELAKGKAMDKVLRQCLQ
jgi:uncharacterized protein YdhG (YjbR/CyaY superfamily)